MGTPYRRTLQERHGIMTTRNARKSPEVEPDSRVPVAQADEDDDFHSLNFADAEVPTVRRERRNPFDNKVSELAAGMGDGDRSPRAIVVTVRQTRKAKTLAQAQNAGRFHGVTVRHTVVDHENGTATFTLWTVKRIVRARKDK